MTRRERRLAIGLGTINIGGGLIASVAMARVGGSTATDLLVTLVIVVLGLVLTFVEIRIIRALLFRRR